MKRILLTGTGEKSIGRFIGKQFHEMGWEVWLYSRNAKINNDERWHERKCDIASEEDVERLLEEISSLDIAVQLADAGNVHVPLEELKAYDISKCMNAKLTGSLIITKQLLKKSKKQGRPIKLIWCCGKISEKPKQLIIYSIINSGIAAYISELNRHYGHEFKAYYLPTTLISPSTIGDDYIKKYGGEEIAKSPSLISDKIKEIAQNEITVGIVKMEEVLI